MNIIHSEISDATLGRETRTNKENQVLNRQTPDYRNEDRWLTLGANYDDTLIHNSDDSLNSELYSIPGTITHSSKNTCSPNVSVDLYNIRNMEEEQELLTSYLMALTSHFAHVQLRVRQIVEAPSDQRDELLKNLEEFAFKAIPEPISHGLSASGNNDDADTEGIRRGQFELIDHVKKQLTDIENFAYDSGAPILPQHILLEKQRIIIDELKRKLNLKVKDTDLAELTSEDLRNQVDSAFGEFVGPLKMKEQLVAQLKTQISDLERFIAFLQCDSFHSKLKTKNYIGKSNDAYNSYAAKKKSSCMRHKWLSEPHENIEVNLTTENTPFPIRSVKTVSSNRTESFNNKTLGIMNKASMILQMFTTTHFGHRSDCFQRNGLKKTFKGNHWGDLRAQLEIDIQEVASLAATLSYDHEKLVTIKKTLQKKVQDEHLRYALLNNDATGKTEKNISDFQKDISTDSEDDKDFYNWQKKRVTHDLRNNSDSISLISKELTSAVRKNFAVTLQRLIQHGLCAQSDSAASIIVPFMKCLNPSQTYKSYTSEPAFHFKSNTSFVYSSFKDSTREQSYDCNDSGRYCGVADRQMHAWELIMEYYHFKNGDEFNNTPARKLSQSFNLDIVSSKAVSNKQSLLSAIPMIVALHQPYKKSYNSYFKAFVCAGLNSHQLIEWLNLIFSCTELVDTYYTPGSYATQTGFRDSLHSIKVLLKYDFDLPVDLAVKQFKNI